MSSKVIRRYLTVFPCSKLTQCLISKIEIQCIWVIEVIILGVVMLIVPNIRLGFIASLLILTLDLYKSCQAIQCKDFVSGLRQSYGTGLSFQKLFHL